MSYRNYDFNDFFDERDEPDLPGIVRYEDTSWRDETASLAIAERIRERHAEDIAAGEVTPEQADRWVSQWYWEQNIKPRNQDIQQKHREQQRCRSALEALCPRHAPVILNNGIETTPAIAAMRAWATDRSRCILVASGPPGTGKTTIAALWCWERMQQNGDNSRALPHWFTAAEFARSSRYDKERGELIGVPALVLDDLGVEYADAKGSLRTDIDELVDSFYSSTRRLLVTTNLDAKGFEERYGARVMDRIAEAGTWLPVLGASRRRK